MASAGDRGVRDTPAPHTTEEFERGVEVIGAYPLTSQHEPALSDMQGLSRRHARVLALCSYITGMEIPGFKSLFTRITLRFHAEADDAADLRYRARTVRFGRSFRLLDTELQVLTPEGRLVATGLLRSYVPFSPVQADPQELSDRLVRAAGGYTTRWLSFSGQSRSWKRCDLGACDWRVPRVRQRST